MGAYPGTHVHTADQAIPPLNSDLTTLCEDLTGFHPGIDLLIDAVRLIATQRHTLTQTQMLLTVLQGSTDEAGQQIDVAALLAALAARLLNPAENPCLRTLPTDVQEQAAETGTELQAHDADFTPRHLTAKTVANLQPTDHH